MPSPVGHALAGVAVGWVVQGRPARLTRAGALTTAAYAIVAASPDLDLFLESHRGPTHGIGFAVIAGLVAWILTRRTRTASAFALAYGSHVLLDWLGTDTTPPIGLMALWPLSREFYESPYHIFMAVSRRYWLPEFWTYNFGVLVREVLILAPVVVGVGLLRRRRRGAAAVAVACVLLHGAVVPQAFAQVKPSYADALSKYRAGQFETAVRLLASLPTRDVENKRDLFEPTATGGRRDGDIRAAIMLHTELHFEEAGLVAHTGSWHLDHARNLARTYFDLRGERGDRAVFVREWFLLLAAQFQGVAHVSRGAEYLAEARSLFPGDAEILLASGAHYENLPLLGRIVHFDRTGNRSRVDRVNVPEALATAARHFREALAANPRLDEAGLRLGRTLHHLRDLPGAAKELEAVRARTGTDTIKYLAALFLAPVEDELGRRPRAAELYAEAMKWFPATQAAYVGFSEALYLDAQPAEAARVMTMLLERPAPRDPFWAYLMGEWWHYDARLAAMRRQVQQ